MAHTVLVVEDEADLREMMREALELNGYDVLAAEDGAQALAALDQAEHVCLVLLDLLMPGMNGWEFFARLKQHPSLSKTPVIVHSSSPSRAPAGVTGIVRKPLSLDMLLTLVRRHCSG